MLGTTQEKLAHVAATVGKIGASVAATCFIALLIKWCVVNRGFPLHKINDHGPVQVRAAARQQSLALPAVRRALLLLLACAAALPLLCCVQPAADGCVTTLP